MPIFTYIARDRNGLQRVDAIESATREAAVIALRAQGLLPIKIEELSKSKVSGPRFSMNPFAYRAFNESDIEHEFHQIAVMLRSGISLLDAIQLTLKHCRIGARSTWERLAKRIQQGSALTDAMAEHKIFSEFTIQLIRVGEQTGNLNTVLDEAAKEVKSSRKIKKQILTALRYPAFTLLMAIGIVIFMLISLVPEIKKLLKMMGKPMPPITQALIDVSDWFLANGPAIGIFVILVIAVFLVFYNWPPSRLIIDKYSLKIPVIGYVLRLSGTVLFARAMGLLLRSGVVMVDALTTMEKLHVNQYMASRIAFGRSRVLQGSSLAEPLEIESGYMPLLLQMIRVGENSGTLDDILLEMTDYHDELLQRAIATLTGMIAPIMTIFVGGVVGFVYAAFFSRHVFSRRRESKMKQPIYCLNALLLCGLLSSSVLANDTGLTVDQHANTALLNDPSAMTDRLAKALERVGAVSTRRSRRMSDGTGNGELHDPTRMNENFREALDHIVQRKPGIKGSTNPAPPLLDMPGITLVASIFEAQKDNAAVMLRINDKTEIAHVGEKITAISKNQLITVEIMEIHKSHVTVKVLPVNETLILR